VRRHVREPPELIPPPPADASASFTDVAPYYDYLMRHVPYGDWADYTERLFATHRISAEDILDLCCGTGLYGLQLARRGYSVTGADLSYAMVREAARNARKAKLELALTVADACALPFDEQFDVVISVFDSLNNIIHDGGLLAAFRSVARALRPRGWLIFDVNTIRALEEELFTQSRTSDSDTLHYDWVSRWDPRTMLSTIEMAFEWRGCDPPLRFSETHVQRGYSFRDMVEWQEEAGFRVEACYDAYSLRRASDRSTRVFYVARKL